MKFQYRWFTLLEVIIILIIIGLFMTSVLPRLAWIQWRARDVERKSNIQQIISALTNYQLNNGVYIWWSWAVTTVLKELAPVYIRTLPKDPSWNDINTVHWSQSVKGEYLYLSLESKKWYVVMSVSEWWWMHANWISNASSLTLTWLHPWFISSNEQLAAINRSLCSSVSDGMMSRTWNICNWLLDQYEAKYIVARK
jgi:type II secretory pathway pseudopilin PulG